MRKKIFCTGSTRAAKAGQKSLVPARQANGPTKKGPLSFVLFESPFTSSVSTVSMGYPSLVSLEGRLSLSEYNSVSTGWLLCSTSSICNVDEWKRKGYIPIYNKIRRKRFGWAEELHSIVWAPLQCFIPTSTRTYRLVSETDFKQRCKHVLCLHN